jgi:hypothetical protein
VSPPQTGRTGRWFAALLLVACAGLVILGATSAGAAAGSTWSQRTVVPDPDFAVLRAFVRCARVQAAGVAPCEVALLRRRGASASAIRFARRYGGYLASFTDLGRVDVGDERVPAADTDGGVVILNAVPPLIGVPARTPETLLRTDPGYLELKASIPQLTPTFDSGQVVFQGASTGQGGVERLVFQVFLLDACHACETGYAERVAFDFTPARRLSLVTALGVCRLPSLPGAPVVSLPFPSCSGQSAFTQSVVTPGQLSLKLTHVTTNVLLAFVLVLLVPFVTEVFNSTFEANYDRIAAPFAGIGGAFRRRAARIRGRPFSAFAGSMLIVSLLYCFLDPTFGFNRPSLALFAGMLAGLVLVTVVFDAVAAGYVWSRHRSRPSFRAYLAGIPIAVACVVISRAANFLPGYLLGAIGGFTFAVALSRVEEGRLAAWSAAWMLVLSLAAWVARTPVVHAEARHATFGLQVLDSVLAAVVVAGIEGVAFGLIPMRFLEGDSVFAWSRKGWTALFGVSVLAFVFIVLNPTGNFVGATSVGPVWTMVAIVAGFSALTAGLWAYFRWRPEPPGRPPVWGPGPDERRVAKPTGG